MARGGLFRHVVAILLDPTTRDTMGQEIPAGSAAVVAQNVRAKIEEAAGGETLRGKQVDATTTHVVTIRYRAGVTPQMYVSWGSRTLGITAVLDRTGRKRELELHCQEAH